MPDQLRENKMARLKRAPDGSFCIFKRKSKELDRFVYLGKDTLELGDIRIPEELRGKRFLIRLIPLHTLK